MVIVNMVLGFKEFYIWGEIYINVDYIVDILYVSVGIVFILVLLINEY